MVPNTAAVIITADSVRDGVDKHIKQDLAEQFGFRLVFEKICQIIQPQVAEIYPNLVREEFFSALVHNLTLGPSILLLYEGDDIFVELKKAKGIFKLNGLSIDKTGLRLKYQGPSSADLIKSGYQGQLFLNRLFEFRLHTADNLLETISLCKLLLSSEDYGALVGISSQNGGI
jgi:nucleoside diphosphate kinase